MIITVTLNPAMDQTVVLDHLVPGENNRVRASRTDPGGKGVNVSRVLRELGASTLAMGFVSGSIGRFIEASLNEIGVNDDFIHTPGQTRINVVIVEEDENLYTTIDVPGPETGEHYVQELKHRLKKRVSEGVWVVMAGSVPPHVPADTYMELIDLVRSLKGIPVLDASGEALRLGVRRKPVLIKPNRQELSQIVGRPLMSIDDVVQEASALQKSGIQYVIVSMGGEGAIGVSDAGAYLAVPPKVKVGSALGAGDSMVAGLVYSLSEGKAFSEGLRLGSAAGAASAMSTGTQLAQAEDIFRLLPGVTLTKL